MLVPRPYDHAQCPTTPILGIFEHLECGTDDKFEDMMPAGKPQDLAVQELLEDNACPSKLSSIRRGCIEPARDDFVRYPPCVEC